MRAPRMVSKRWLGRVHLGRGVLAGHGTHVGHVGSISVSCGGAEARLAALDWKADRPAGHGIIVLLGHGIIVLLGHGIRVHLHAVDDWSA